jgi:hypothetical protein
MKLVSLFLQIAEENISRRRQFKIQNSCVLKIFPGKSVVLILLISVLGCFLGICRSVLDPDSLIPDPDPAF